MARYGAKEQVKGKVLARTKKRAERLGLDTKESYTGKQARGIRQQVAAQKPAKQLTGTSAPAVNRVQSGPGSQRKGKRYRVKWDPNKQRYVHVYGQGEDAKRVYLRKSNPFSKQYRKAGLYR